MCAVWKNVLQLLFRGDNGTEEIHHQDHLFTTTGCHAIDHAGWGGVTTLDNKSHTQEGKSPRWAQRVQLATPAVRCHKALGYCCGGFPVPSAPRCRAAVTAFRLRSLKQTLCDFLSKTLAALGINYRAAMELGLLATIT